MKQFNIKIIYRNYVIRTIAEFAKHEDDALVQAFKIADEILSEMLGSDFKQEDVELYIIGKPSHDRLFKDVNTDLEAFKN